jgi:hypothetical protein
MKLMIIILSALSCFVTTVSYALDDPFDSPMAKAIRNCSGEYRFKYDEKITTAEAFIEFLKDHQGGNKYLNAPTKDRLVPMYVEGRPGSTVTAKAGTDKSKIKVDLDLLKKRIKVFEIQNSLRKNKKIYKVSLGWGLYSGQPYAWRIAIQMSDNGDVSVRYCAGK